MSNTIKVYWAPADFNLNTVPKDNNMLYYDPLNLLNILKNNKSNLLKNDSVRNTFFSCPVFSKLSKNIFVLENPLKTDIEINNSTIKYNGETGIPSVVTHPPSLNNQILFVYNMKWVFFTDDESLNMKLTSPYFSNSNHMRYGSIVPGQLDIGKWFRNVTLEYNLWEGVNKFSIDKGEHLAYIEFETDKKVELIRFKLNTELKTYLESTSSSSNWEPKVSIQERYERFKRTRMKDLVMKEIKTNVLDSSKNN
jgi:hypothetical protein